MSMKIATLALIVSDGRVLLGTKHPNAEIGKGLLNGPGGKLEEGESLVECVTRETLQETGVVLDSDDLDEVAVLTCINDSSPAWKVHVFLARSFSGEPVATPEMRPDPEWWYPIGQIPFHRMHGADAIWMPKALKGDKFRADIYQNADATVCDRVEFKAY